jgi:hypothetical protein
MTKYLALAMALVAFGAAPAPASAGMHKHHAAERGSLYDYERIAYGPGFVTIVCAQGSRFYPLCLGR